MLGQLNAALHAAELWCRARERQRTTVAMLVHEQRLTALELARRGVAAGVIERPEQIFMLLADELDTYVAAVEGSDEGATLKGVLADRETQYLALFDYEPPFVIAGDPPPLSEWARRSQAVRADAAGHRRVDPGRPGLPGHGPGDGPGGARPVRPRPSWGPATC